MEIRGKECSSSVLIKDSVQPSRSRHDGKAAGNGKRKKENRQPILRGKKILPILKISFYILDEARPVRALSEKEKHPATPKICLLTRDQEITTLQ